VRYISHFFISIVLLLLPSLASANAGPAYEDAFPDINLIPVYNSHIKVTEENLVFDIATNPGSFNSVKADVVVNYLLKNTSDQEETLLLAFPFEGTYSRVKSDIVIVFDGKEVNYDLFSSEVEDSLNEGKHQFFSDQGELTFAEMLSFVRLEADEGLNSSESYKMKVILFELTFLPQTRHNLIVSYTTLPSLEREDALIPYIIETPWHPVFVYYLEPAKYWADFENLTITIRTPANFPLRDISIPGIDLVEPGYYQGTFNSLPQSNLVFSLTNQDSVKRMERGEIIWRLVWYSILFLFLLMVFFIARKIYQVNFINK
jgi:hypothetical protein